MEKNKTNTEEKYKLTPKGIFALSLKRLNLIDDVMDWRADAAWEIFKLMMERCGYIDTGDDD